MHSLSKKGSRNLEFKVNANFNVNAEVNLNVKVKTNGNVFASFNFNVGVVLPKWGLPSN